MQKLFEVIYEDFEFLVINKPAGLVCHPTKTDEYSSLISRVRLYLGPGAQPQLINRLDRETSGVTLIAKNEAAARTLRRLWEQRQVRKEYLAIVHGQVRETHGSVVARLGRDQHSLVAIKDCVRDDGVEASTEFWLQERFMKEISLAGKPSKPSRGTDQAGATGSSCWFSLLRVTPHTGRKHQIRIHLAHIGHPIVGDKLYAGDEDLYLALVENRLTTNQRSRLILPHHGLHASKVRFRWGTRQNVFQAVPEPWFKGFCPATAFPD